MSVLIKPGSPEHARTISPSKVAAILGVSRYESPYRLWHRMKGLVPPEPPKDIFVVGHAMEPALAYLWKDENPGWQLSPGEVQIQTGDRFSFPAVVTMDRRARRGGAGAARRIVEMKTARDMDAWGDEFTDEAPADYFVQVIAQEHFTGYTEFAGHLTVMGPFFKHHTYVIGYDPELGNAIEEKCAEFYASLSADTPPELDDSVATYECVRQLHPDIDGTEVQVDPDLALEFLTDAVALDEQEKATRASRTRLLDVVKKGQTVTCGGVKVANRQRNGHGSVSLVASKKNISKIRELVLA